MAPAPLKRWLRALAATLAALAALAGTARMGLGRARVLELLGWAFGSDAVDLDPRAWMASGRRACAPLGARAELEPVQIGEGAAHRIVAPYGVLLFAYGETVELVRKYGAEAVVTAEALRRTNPLLPVAIASNFPNATVAAGSATALFRSPQPFTLVLPIRPDAMIYPSTVRPRYEWLTRLHYMSLSPFELTLTLDSHTLPCTADDAAAAGAAWRAGSELATALAALPALHSPRRWFDLGYNTFVTSGRPHNWALLYYTRAPAMRALFTDWYVAYLAQGGDDQGPLEHAARARARAGALRLARLHTNLVGAFERVNDFQISDWPRVTHVLTGPVTLFHVRYGDEATRRALCAMLNAPAHARARRVLVQPRGGHKGLYAHAWPMARSAEEYRRATGGYAAPARGHVNEFTWAAPECGTARGRNGSAAPEQSGVVAEFGAAEPMVYPFEHHARLPCWRAERLAKGMMTL
jgi:hypothetical protein